MDDVRLGFYYNLLSYSIGIILSVFLKDYILSGFILNALLCFLPLTLLITDSENMTTNYVITNVFPCLIGLWGIGLGSFIIFFDSKMKKNKSNENEIVPHKYDKIKRIGKCSSIFIILFVICLLYILDVTIPFAVYFKPYLLCHFLIETFLLIIIICLCLSFGMYDQAFLWFLTSFVLLSILSTIFFIFKIINDNYFWNFLFIIHSIIIITLLYTFKYGYYLFKYIKLNYYDSNKEDDDQNQELTEINNTIPL